MPDRTSATDSISRGSFSRERAVQWMLSLFAGWFCVYLLLQGQNGFFARTVERVHAEWLALLFLNVPLQIALAFVTWIGGSLGRTSGLRLALGAGALNTALITIHVISSFATA